MASKKISTNRKLDDHVSDKFDILETGAQNAPVKDIHWQGQTLETESDVHLEDDKGSGGAALIRAFDFSANPEAFRQHLPSKQELFNTHYKQIEILLWRDGLQVYHEVNPRVIISKNRKNYRIIVAALPQRGHLLQEKPKLLKDVAHGT